jgi:hypothetical protein
MSWLNCGVTTQAIWPEKQKEVKYGNHTFILMPLTKEHSASVHIELKGISDVEGAIRPSTIMGGAEIQFLYLFQGIGSHSDTAHRNSFRMKYMKLLTRKQN